MSKRFCKDDEVLKPKMKGRKNHYLCIKCDRKSFKEKWLCFVSPIEKKKKNKKG